MTVSLNTLEIDPAMLETVRAAISKMAYFKWEAAGCPPGDGVQFWLEAEREWIEHSYVPARPLEALQSQHSQPQPSRVSMPDSTSGSSAQVTRSNRRRLSKSAK